MHRFVCTGTALTAKSLFQVCCVGGGTETGFHLRQDRILSTRVIILVAQGIPSMCTFPSVESVTWHSPNFKKLYRQSMAFFCETCM